VTEDDEAEETAFGRALRKLVSGSFKDARKSPEAAADMIQCLAHALGCTVAVAAHGHAEAIDTLIAGAEAHAHSSAVAYAPFAALAAAAMRRD
jgi:hypothetical protein